MKQYSMRHTIVHKQSVKGATLIEVLVSVFLLTFGILGLMAAQLNSVAAVSESENRAIAAQAAENLAEAMQANPKLAIGGKRDYGEYITAGNKWVDAVNIDSCGSDSASTATAGTSAVAASSAKKACALVGNVDISKKELVDAQLGEFQFILQQMPNTVDLKYTICLDEVKDLAKEAEAPSLIDTQCTGAGGQPVIKVIWSSMGKAMAASTENNTGIPDKHTQLYYLVLAE